MTELGICFQDATTNDVPSDLFDVKGFPTLYFYSASGVVISFDGDRTKEGMIQFINEHRSKTASLDEAVEETASIKDELWEENGMNFVDGYWRRAYYGWRREND